MAALSIAEQDRRIRAAWPGFRTIIASERLGIWRGVVQGLSHPYTVEIVYARNRHGDPFRYAYAPFPEVTVLDPPLSRRFDDPNDPIPHVYIDPDRARPVLCLFDPRAKGWGRHEVIADTILAWTASWLRFYEAWHATGVWTGGGASHGPIACPPAAGREAEELPAPASEPHDRRRALLHSASPDVLNLFLDARAQAAQAPPPPAARARRGRDRGSRRIGLHAAMLAVGSSAPQGGPPQAALEVRS